MSNTPLYKVQGLSFDYQLGNTQVPALRDIELEIPAGSFICLAGPSGSGKSTLLNVLGLIEPVQGGSVYFQGQNLAGLSEAQKNQLRKYKLGFIFQNFHLIPVLSAAENIEYFLSRQGIPATERAQRVDEALQAVGLLAHRNQRPTELSGGQRQRVAIARALAKKPDVIIADEPTASLDQNTGREIMKILKDLNQNQGVSIVISSHDPMVLAQVPQMIYLHDGKIAPASQAHGGATETQHRAKETSQ